LTCLRYGYLRNTLLFGFSLAGFVLAGLLLAIQLQLLATWLGIYVVTDAGRYYLPATDETIPADMATPSPALAGHHIRSTILAEGGTQETLARKDTGASA
jgi:hypothetical protein